ncbi:response regulator [Anoxynatronum sibiricum]|uniref:Stage 0 sporulation protein A homolog n=1 Tax=Anoxynatronum sibiricum TaxID=210623 RepID=A0ABU9VY57_9CLOT
MITPYKVLLVDDESDYRATSRMLLESEGYLVSDVCSTKAALESLEQEYYPIVISDIIMPGDTGFALLLEIKKRYGMLFKSLLSQVLAASKVLLKQ